MFGLAGRSLWQRLFGWTVSGAPTINGNR